jgi:hypothetical protein
MKKYLILLVLLIMAAPVFSQARLGRNIFEIKSEYAKYSVKEQKLGDSDMLLIDLPQAYVKHVFDDEGDCILSLIIPKDSPAIQHYVERYNKELVIISPTEWRFYVGGSIAQVKLITTDDKSIMFLWSFME